MSDVNHDELAVINIMKTKDGRDWLYNKLQSCGVFESIFDNDTHKHAYNAGKRKVGVNLNRELKEYAPDNYMKMIEENL